MFRSSTWNSPSQAMMRGLVWCLLLTALAAADTTGEPLPEGVAASAVPIESAVPEMPAKIPLPVQAGSIDAAVEGTAEPVPATPPPLEAVATLTATAATPAAASALTEESEVSTAWWGGWGWRSNRKPTWPSWSGWFHRKSTTAWQIINSKPELTTLASLIRQNGLVAALDKPGLTVFAPTNQALGSLLGALPQGTPPVGLLVQNILTQHVVAKVLLWPSSGQSYATLNPGNPVTPLGHPMSSVRSGQGNVVGVIGRDVERTAAVYIINGVLLPNNAFANVESALQYWGLTTLAGLLTAFNLNGPVNNPAPQKTLFAPTNAAFRAIQSTVDSLSEEQVATVLGYHVTPAVYTVPWRSRSGIPTLAQQTLDLVADRFIADTTSTTAKVVTAFNVAFPGGVLQGIDKVLIPAL